MGKEHFPCLGITEHGPAFTNRHKIAGFFDQLLQTFPDMTWTPLAHSTPLTSADSVGIQMDVKGTHSAGWYPQGHPHFSMPLSELQHGSNKTTDVAAFGLFSFDPDGKIRQIQIYMDRYKMMHQVAPDHLETIHLPRARFSA